MTYLESRPLKKCDKCGKDMVLRFSSKNASYFVGCVGFPDCRETRNVIVSDLVNHLVLARYYLDELTKEVAGNMELHRGDWVAIDSLIEQAKGAKEHIDIEWEQVRDFYEPIYRLDFWEK